VKGIYGVRNTPVARYMRDMKTREFYLEQGCRLNEEFQKGWNHYEGKRQALRHPNEDGYVGVDDEEADPGRQRVAGMV
jgi:hypothetical protein